MQKYTQQHGFSLLEVLFALIIMTTVIYVSLSFVHEQLCLTKNAFEKTVVLNDLMNLAESLMSVDSNAQKELILHQWRNQITLTENVTVALYNRNQQTLLKLCCRHFHDRLKQKKNKKQCIQITITNNKDLHSLN